MWLSISHIPGRFNSESGHGSRSLSSATEWELPQELFNKLLQHFRTHGPVIMDLFASHLNYKLKPYCSFGPDPYCVHVDCFTMPWDSRYIYYANPPFSVMTKTIQKVQQEKSALMVVFPFWQQQIWLNCLLELLISEVVILPKNSPPPSCCETPLQCTHWPTTWLFVRLSYLETIQRGWHFKRKCRLPP